MKMDAFEKNVCTKCKWYDPEFSCLEIGECMETEENIREGMKQMEEHYWKQGELP